MARGRRSTAGLSPAPSVARSAPAGARVSARYAGHTPEAALAALAREPQEVRRALGQSGMRALRRLAQVAPGTFFHARDVADLVAVAHLGPQERAAVLLHDIGKMVRPEVFAENGGADVRPEAEVLRAHVVDGLRLARELGLSRMATDAIAEHHGTLAVSEGESYPGPAPRSLFTAALMCADFLESLHSQGRLTAELACEIYLSRVQHGQFSGVLERRTREAFVAMLGRLLGDEDRSAMRARAREVIEAPLPPPLPAPVRRRATEIPEPLGGSPMARSRPSTGEGFHSYA